MLTVWSDADAQSDRICQDGKRAYFGVCPEGNATRPPPPRPTETLLAGRYRDHGDGTVTDTQTSRQWMRCSLGQTWRGGTCAGTAKAYTWELASGAAKDINAQGGYAGYRDWRVPSREELLSLVYCSSGKPRSWNDTGKWCEGDYSRPTIDTTAFPNTPASVVFWSASSYGPYSAYAWYVYFGNGNDGAFGKSSVIPARLVRGGQ